MHSVFAGDQRPAMMERGQIRRPTTLIDPSSLQRPISQHMNSHDSSEFGLLRRGSRNSKPLLNFDNDTPGGPDLTAGSRMTAAKSVFGVDTLWEREVAKLKEIEALEKQEAEERRIREEAANAKKAQKKKKKKKSDKEEANTGFLAETDKKIQFLSPIAADSPILPDIPRMAARRRTDIPSPGDNSDGESSSSEVDMPVNPRDTAGAQAWISDDEEPANQRKTSVGLNRLEHDRAPQPTMQEQDSSDDDIPLSAAIERVARKLTMASNRSDDTEDEDKPLAALLNKSDAAAAPSLPNLSAFANEDQEDNEPLGIRASRFLPTAGDDDDRPLALHPQQQRRTQYQMLAQQQQAMYQAQLRNTMAFGAPPSMFGPAFSPFTPPLQPFMAPMMATPVSPPQQLEEVVKFGRVDRWRRDVAVEGEE